MIIGIGSRTYLIEERNMEWNLIVAALGSDYIFRYLRKEMQSDHHCWASHFGNDHFF